MQRRQLLKSIAALSASPLLLSTPLNVLAHPLAEGINKAPSIDYKTLFNHALTNNPALIAFANIEKNFPQQELLVEGNIPKDITGTFYRNGPAKHERSEQRYQHLFEGDGMLQSFTFAEGKIVHQGKFIQTPKFQKEQSAQRFLYSGPDTKVANSLPVTNANIINTANTNIITVGDDLWALWEAGSASKINIETLEYEGQVVLGENGKYQQSLQGLPFSAHPKIEANGDIWNFGLAPSGHVALYHLSAKGQVKNVGLINAQYNGGMLHDFLITDKHILLILPSLKKESSTDNPVYFSGVKFDENIPMRVLVISKSELTIKKEYQLPAGFAFHYGNAWEEKNGAIRFDASLYPNIDVLHNFSNYMKGKTDQPHQNAKMAFFTLYPNGTSDHTVLKNTSEFPEVCDHLVGQKNQLIYHLSTSENQLWSHAVCAQNIETGKIDRYDFGEDYLVEEHITVCPQNKEGTGYLIGTALHVPSKRTCLNIFQASNLADGPIARAWLSHHLPLGFHGSFRSA